jgi:hypothetical protein
LPNGLTGSNCNCGSIGLGRFGEAGRWAPLLG